MKFAQMVGMQCCCPNSQQCMWVYQISVKYTRIKTCKCTPKKNKKPRYEPHCTTAQCRAKFLHCVCTACILRTQRLGYSPKNTCHLSRGWGFLEDPLAPRHKANAQMQ